MAYKGTEWDAGPWDMVDDFGFTDDRGRAVGYQGRFITITVVECEGEPYCGHVPPSKPMGHVSLLLDTQATRAGKRFGASTRSIELGEDTPKAREEGRAAYVTRRDKARKRYARKFGGNADA